MNEGRDVWSGGNMAERSAEIRKSLKHGFNRYMGSELFPKKIPPTEVEIMEKELEQVQVDIEKERERRRGEVIEKEKAPEVEKAPEGNTEAPFVSGSLVDKDGTSEGAKLGWETRKRGGAGAKEEDKPKYTFNPEEELPGLKGLDHDKARKIEEQMDDVDQTLRHTKKNLDHMNSLSQREGRRLGEEHPYHDVKSGVSEGMKQIDSLLESIKGHSDEGKRQALVDGAKKIRDDYDRYGDEGLEEAFNGLSNLSSKITAFIGGEEESKKSLSELLDEVAEKYLPARTETITKDDIEKILKDGGWDKLPLTDRAREVIEDAITKGARPVTEYTGKVLVEHAIPEEPPAFTRPKKLNVGDTVIPLSWVGVCTQGAKFDLPNVPAAAKVKKMYVGPAKVSKDSYPYGRYPSDISKVETVMEDRLWGLELEDSVKKAEDEGVNLPLTTRDTTLVLRVDALATPSGEVNTGEPARD